MELSKQINKFNFFKKEKEKPLMKDFFDLFLYMSKKIPLIFNWFVTTPALCYYLLNKISTEQLILSSELESIPKVSFLSLVITTYTLMVAYITILDLIQSKNTKYDMSKYTIFLPIRIVFEFGFIIHAVPYIWSIIWPYIR